MSADRNLLFGVLALQLDFITRDQLLAGMQAWVNDKGKPLAEILQAAGALDATNRKLLEPLVERHIQQHGNDPQQSLASLSSAERLRQELAEVQDAEVTQSLITLGRDRPRSTNPLVRASEGSSEPMGSDYARDKWQISTLSIGEQTSAGTRFRILRPHARGGLGEVFVARDTELGREVALKEIQHGKSDDPEARARFTREAEITGGLEHPGIVPVYGLGAYPDGRPFYAMRFIRGKSLHDAIKAYHAREKASPTEQNLELRRLLQRFIDVCEAIDYAHSRGVLHRDLKPGNIMLGRYGETLVVDWGLAKAVGRVSNPSAASSDEPNEASASQLPEPPLVPGSHGSSEATQLGSALGTIAYMSPEQANGRIDQLGPTSDVFSLGATLFHLLTGQPPYTGKFDEAYANAKTGEYPHPRAIARSIPIPLEAICLKALAPNPKQRYHSAQALAQDLERYLADEPVEALPDSLVSRASRWARHHRHWMQAGSVAILFVATTAIGAYFYQRETALQNLKLASEKGKLAEEKSKLASDKTKLADEATAKAEALRIALAQNYFAHGVSEYAAGRVNQGTIDLQRAHAVVPRGYPLLRPYEQVLFDRALRGASSSLPLQHEDGVYAVAFSHEGDRVVTGSLDNFARLWDARTGAPLGGLLQHDSAVVAVAFSPRGDRVVTGSNDNTARLWDAWTGAPLGQPLRHVGPVVAVAFSPAGDRVLTGSHDGTAQLWNAQNGAPLGKPFRHGGNLRERPIRSHEVTVLTSSTWQIATSLLEPPPGLLVYAVAISPQGDRVLTGGDDHTARLWDAQTGAMISKPLLHAAPVFAVAFSPQGDRILTGSLDSTARLWDARTGESLGEPLRHDGSVVAVAFSPQGDHVLTGSGDKTARLWDARTGAPIGNPLRHGDYVRAVAFSPQGDRAMTGSDDKTARMWDVRTSAPIGGPLQHDDKVFAVSFSPQGDRVLTGSFDMTARLWSAWTGAPLRYESSVWAVKISPLGVRVVTVNTDGTARLWDARTGATLGEPLRHEEPVTDVAFSPDGDRVLTGSSDKCARLWDARTGASLGEPLRNTASVLSVAFSPRGDRFVTVCHDATARLWDTRAGTQIGETLRHEDALWEAEFSPKGDSVLTRCTNGTVQIWDALTGAPLGEPILHACDAEFSPEGDRVLTGNGFSIGDVRRDEGEGQIWDARTGKAVGTQLVHEGSVGSVAFSPLGDLVLTGSEDNTARLWNARTGAPHGVPLWHGGTVNAVAFSPQGDRVLTGSDDRTARLWDARTGAPLGEPLRHDDIVNSVAFSPQGDRVATGSYDKTARLWDAWTGAPLGEPLRHENAVMTVAFSSQGDRILTGSNKKFSQLWDVSVSRPENTREFTVLVTGHDVDKDGNLKQLSQVEYQQRRERFCATEAGWLTAWEKPAHERQRQYLQRGLTNTDLFAVYQSARWLPAEELAKFEAKSLKMPAMEVLVAWFRDGKLDGVAGVLVESEEVSGSGKAEVLKALQESIPVLYWVTDERLAGLEKALGGEAGAK